MVRKQYIQFPAFLVNQAEQNKPSQWEERGKNIGLLVYVDDLILKQRLPLFYFPPNFSLQKHTLTSKYMNIHVIQPGL